MHGGDRRLHLVRSDRPGAERPLDERHALRDLPGIPQRAILLGERDELARALTGRALIMGGMFTEVTPGFGGACPAATRAQ